MSLDQRDLRAKIDGFRPTPGMPADVYIRTGERTFFNYILRPLLDSLSRSRSGSTERDQSARSDRERCRAESGLSGQRPGPDGLRAAIWASPAGAVSAAT